MAIDFHLIKPGQLYRLDSQGLFYTINSTLWIPEGSILLSVAPTSLKEIEDFKKRYGLFISRLYWFLYKNEKCVIEDTLDTPLFSLLK